MVFNRFSVLDFFNVKLFIMEIFYLIVIVFFASLVKGVTGFGFALVSLPFLMFWYSPKEIIPILILCNLFTSLIIILQKKDRKLVDDKYKVMIYYASFFTIIGVLILKYLPEDDLIVFMSVFFIFMSLLSIVGLKIFKKAKKIMSKRSCKYMGAFLGFITGSISISGPPMVLFLQRAEVDKQEFREIFAWFSVSTAFIASVVYVFLGFFNTENIKLILMFLPLLYIGTFVGKRLNAYISAQMFKSFSILLVIVSSIILLLK